LRVCPTATESNVSSDDLIT